MSLNRGFSSSIGGGWRSSLSPPREGLSTRHVDIGWGTPPATSGGKGAVGGDGAGPSAFGAAAGSSSHGGSAERVIDVVTRVGGSSASTDSSLAVQVGMLRGRVTALREELSVAKRDSRDALEKQAQLSAQLSAEKVQHSTLRQKYNGLMTQLTAAEQRGQSTEEELTRERDARQVALVAERKERERELLFLRDELQREQTTSQSARVALLEAQQQQRIPMEEMRKIEKLFQLHYEDMLNRVSSVMDRLLHAHEEGETSTFVARSAVLSAATELEARLANTEAALQRTNQCCSLLTGELDESTSKLIAELSQENSELLHHKNVLLSEAQELHQEVYQLRENRSDWIPKQELEFHRQQNLLLNSKLKEAQETIERQTRLDHDLEARGQELLSVNATLQRRIADAEQGASKSALEAQQRDHKIREMTLQAGQHEQQHTEVRLRLAHTEEQVVLLKQRLSDTEKQLEEERQAGEMLVKKVREDAAASAVQLQRDRDAGLQRVSHLETQLTRATASCDTVEREYSARLRTAQEEHQQLKSQMEHEMALARASLEERSQDCTRGAREIEELRHEISASRTTAHTNEKTLSALRNEFETLRGEKQSVDDRLRLAVQELEDVKRRHHLSESKVLSVTTELNNLRSHTSTLEGLLQGERERHNTALLSMEAGWREEEHVRGQLIEELQRLRLYATSTADGSPFSASLAAVETKLREQLNMEKESLMAENARLQDLYQDVLRRNVDLNDQLATARAERGSGRAAAEKAEVEALKQRVTEVSTLRHQLQDAFMEQRRLKLDAEELRKERDDLRRRMDGVLEEQRMAARKESGLDRVFREASAQMQRLDEQLEGVSSQLKGGKGKKGGWSAEQ